ncbi:porin family protein [Proteiniphilum sp.]|uniref:porin family protein n=1 Tax=Proteiniphilum sp. TaxID=1926877 RepID=UPI002B215532|nr:porin family protein [Proteiniphilum sp.]MEA4917416.1 porin family protein [Proteiniphilum sp.]
MRKMKFSLIAVMLVVVTAVSAQQLSLGVKGGVNMSNFYGDELNDKNMKIGFHIGLAADYDLAPNSAIQTGLYFTTKGAKYSASAGSASAEVTVNPMYLQLPVHYAYKLDVSPGTRVVFHAGPYLAYGVAGKSKFKGSLGENSVEEDGANVFGDDKLFKPFDAGLGLGVGTEFGQIMLDLGWDMGLVNIANSGTVKNQNAYLSVGYKF